MKNQKNMDELLTSESRPEGDSVPAGWNGKQKIEIDDRWDALCYSYQVHFLLLLLFIRYLYDVHVDKILNY